MVLADGRIIIVNEKEHPGLLLLFQFLGMRNLLYIFRFMVGCTGSGPCFWCHNTLQSNRVSRSSSIRWKFDLVSLSAVARSLQDIETIVVTFIQPQPSLSSSISVTA